MQRKGEAFTSRVNRVADALAERREKRRERKEASGEKVAMRPMTRRATPSPERVEKKLKPIIAYDFETTRIGKGTPKLLYMTAYGADFHFSGEIMGTRHLAEILEARFLLPELSGTRFVAWNANKFDAYFIAMALLKMPHYIIRPYMTRSKALRGLRIILRQYVDGVEVTGQKGIKPVYWEFLDGMAMLGILKSLKDFLAKFAPDFGKLAGPDFESEDFNPRKPEHVAYAERDSEGLYHGLMKARALTLQYFAIDLCPTIGNMGIKIFERHIPMGVECWQPPVRALRVVRDVVMRGGFCYIARKYKGPIIKLDINQCYAAAMREAKLPCGRIFHTEGRNKYADVYIGRVRATHPTNQVPFYYRDISTNLAVFGIGHIDDTWLTSLEIEQLEREGWRVEVSESWFWQSRFNMKAYVDKLEWLRTGEGRDPKDAQGEMMKYIGNNSYGKTVEKLDGLELVMASEQPEGFASYDTGDGGPEYVWYKFGEPMLREYHQPQIGAFITAHARMVLRRGILQAPDAWLYADTDCLAFEHRPDILARFDIDPGRYGAWKLEENGAEYIFVQKKCYVSMDGKTKHAKGLNVKRLEVGDFQKWFDGVAPSQTQDQRQNFIKVLAGADMFIERTKVGENFENTRKRAERAAA